MNNECEVLSQLIRDHGWKQPDNQDVEILHLMIDMFSYVGRELKIIPELENWEFTIKRYMTEHPCPPHWHCDDDGVLWMFSPPTMATAIYSIAALSGDEERQQKSREMLDFVRSVKLASARETILRIGERILRYGGRPKEELVHIQELFDQYAALDANNMDNEKRLRLEQEMSAAIADK